MIGFVTTQATADAIQEAIAAAQLARGLPHFWTPGSYPIHSGTHAGMVFIPADDTTLTTPLLGHPPQTPQDFPEFGEIIATLGGLGARVVIDPADITPLEP